MSKTETDKKLAPKLEASDRTKLLLERYLERCRLLWCKHEPAFMTILDNGEDHQVNLALGAKLDFKDAKRPKLRVSISYSQRMSDGAEDQFDLNQGTLIDPAGKGKEEAKVNPKLEKSAAHSELDRRLAEAVPGIAEGSQMSAGGHEVGETQVSIPDLKKAHRVRKTTPRHGTRGLSGK